MEKNELTTLQSIAETLRVQPYASQRTLAKNADMSAALMNAVIKRFVERGWIMLSNVNKRKLAYAVTPAGLNELAARGKKFVVRTFRIAHTYNEALTEEIALAKQQGKNKVVLYGESYIKFLLEYASRENQLSMVFIEKRKLILWAAVVFLAMQFHVTALLAFPLYFTLNKQISVPISIVLFLFCVVITFFGLSVIRGMLTLVTLLPFVPERIQIIGNSYLNSTIYGQQSQFGTGLGFIVRYIFIALMIFFYAFGKNKGYSEKNYYFLNFFIGLIFQAMGRNFDQFGRIANYYLICGGGLCAYNLLIDCKSFFRKTTVVRLGMCTIFLLFMAYNFYNTWTSKPKFFNSYKDDYTPYKSVLFENKDI